jgi:dihydrofolate reductase
VAWAGSGLVSTLTRLDLVDEYRLIICPVVLGAGTPFFEKELKPKLKLVRTTQLGGSVVVLCYEPIRT